jgi:FkbH-like protein
MATNVSARTQAGAASPLDAPVKLVVWDLDDTLWRGTLSEGAVELDPVRAQIVRELNRRGIVNSICSKNDFADARARLQQEGLWDEFVFASIDWSAKGRRVAQLIEDMQLRAPNVLFIDDNVGNLQEALHYAPGLQIADESLLESLLALPQLAGKDDRRLTRREHYRLLERKLSDRQLVTGSNEDFLRSCDIRVELAQATPADASRLLELVNRSNQLNFTKSRLSEAELLALLAAAPERSTGYVRVSDRYGDYGTAGFYSVANGRLTDFVFSCRILNMGVEQWTYAHLGRPQITIVGDVAASLDTPANVDWITLADGSQADHAQAHRSREDRSRGTSGAERPRAANSRILLKGGCDLYLLNGFLGGAIKTEFTYPSSTGAEVHSDHTEVLRRSSREVVERHGETIDRLPFLDRAAFASRIVRRPKSFGTLIFSVLMDYTQGLYRLHDSDFVVGYDQHDVDATDPRNWPALQKRWGHVGIDEPFLAWFSERFEYEGPLSPERFRENIRWLGGLLPDSTRLVLINGAEVPGVNDNEIDRHLHHRRMNRALEDVVEEIPNATICDVRPFVVSRDDLTDNLRHYTRQTYLRMAEELIRLVGGKLEIEERPLIMRLHRAQRKFERTVERAAVRFRLG